MNVDLKKDAFRVEVQMISVQNTCFDICVNDFGKPDLNLDEVHCIDKCSWKYLQVNKTVGNSLHRSTGAPGSAAAEAKRARR